MEGIIVRMQGLKTERYDAAIGVTETGKKLEDLPKEIIIRILGYLIPPWSLRIERRIRHDCGKPKDSDASTHVSSASLAYVSRPSAPQDLRSISRLSKTISSLVKACFIENFTGILEVYHFVLQGHDDKIFRRAESSLTIHGCPCFKKEQRMKKLTDALGIYARKVVAMRLMQSKWRNLDRDLLEILPMSKIIFIDTSAPMIIRYIGEDFSSTKSDEWHDDTLFHAELISMFKCQWNDQTWRLGHAGLETSMVGKEIPTRRLWTGALNSLVEAKVVRGKPLSMVRESELYFYAYFGVRNDAELGVAVQFLGRCSEEEREAEDSGGRLMRYLNVLKSSQ